MPQNPLFFLIDDDLDDQEIFALALEEIDTNLKCITAKDGSEALARIKEDDTFTPDFIFLDLNMPRISGKECLIAIRKIPRLKNIPIYIYSTSSFDKEKSEAIALGAVGFITKPYTVNELIQILTEIIATVKNN